MRYGDVGTMVTQNPVGSTLTDVDESPSQIRDGVSQLEEILSGLHEQISRLDRRFETVLSPTLPAPSMSTAKEPMQVRSHLLGRVALLNEGFGAAMERLRDLSRRCEI